MTPAPQLEAHLLLIRAAGMVKVDPEIAAIYARQAIQLIEPKATVAGILEAADEPLTTAQIARALGVSPGVTMGKLRKLSTARRIGTGSATCWTLRR